MRALFLVLFLAGCGTVPHIPEPIIVPQEVQTILKVKCEFPVVEEPKLLLDSLTKGTDAYDLLKMYSIDEISLKQQVKELKAAIVGCSKTPETQK